MKPRIPILKLNNVINVKYTFLSCEYVNNCTVYIQNKYSS